jgi:uncharacterized LabA/DUF88 family protein
MVEQVVAYIDGFNFYFGLQKKGWQRYYWVNPQLVCYHLLKTLKTQQNLIEVKYFTSRVRGDVEKISRQDTFIRAIKTDASIIVKYGRYGKRKYRCARCKYEGMLPTEKMTDVRIACEIISDAYRDIFRTALLISSDRDFVPVAEFIKQRFQDKKFIVALPPMRRGPDYQGKVTSILHITEDILEKSLFPNEIVLPNGRKITKPHKWI